jgi:hypothetical protein
MRRRSRVPVVCAETSENLETHELTNVSGRYSLDVLRALVCHQTHKLTTYSFSQVP